MSIVRITVRIFQNERHAEIFIIMSEKVYNEGLENKLK
jgi:hypothetical protein